MARILSQVAAVRPPVSVAARIRALRTELAALERQQRDDLMRLIASAYPSGDAFSASQVWHQADLRAACEDAGIGSAQQLGVWLRSWCERVGRDGDGIVWSVGADDLHDEARIPIDG